uniref:Uncharacterized protein n=1 Tax=Anguilla anguilla TaxID=7936 RepID=A0A0E9PKI8_ANGAN
MYALIRTIILILVMKPFTPELTICPKVHSKTLIIFAEQY